MKVPTDGFTADLMTQDMRWLSILMHQLIENHIDMIINLAFKHPLITNHKHIFAFDEKLIIAEALGIFDGEDGKKLKKNVNIIQKIRNHYAHNLDQTSGKRIPSPQADRIKEMHDFFSPDKIDDYDLISVFKFRCMSTIAELNRIADLRQKIKKKLSELEPVLEEMKSEEGHGLNPGKTHYPI